MSEDGMQQYPHTCHIIILTANSVKYRRQVRPHSHTTISKPLLTMSFVDNEISVAAMLCTLILESLCSGDESKCCHTLPLHLANIAVGFQLRRRHADMVVSTLAAGLHRLDVGGNAITTALEYKRRVIASIYCLDKNESSMNGIPFSLSRKFVHLRLPLDLPEQDLFLPREDLMRIADRLHGDGWDTTGRIYRSTLLRVILLLSKYREQILELALSVDLAINPQQIEYVLSSPITLLPLKFDQ